MLLDLYGRIPHLVHASVEGMTAEQLQWRPGSGANPIGWLVWHVGRVEDAQIADLPGIRAGSVAGKSQQCGTGHTRSPENRVRDPGARRAKGSNLICR